MPDAPEVPALFERFCAHVDEMIQHKLREVRAPWERALATAVGRLDGQVSWWLAGSAALALRGVPCAPGDVDLVVGDAAVAWRLLADLALEPAIPMQGWVSDWTGRAWDGALIEWVTPVARDGVPPYEHGPRARAGLHHVEWRGRSVPCAPLDVALQICEARGLTERAAAIRSMRGH